MALRTAIASVVGGTASQLGGGKFSNGAVSAAFVQMFNAERHNLERTKVMYGNGSSSENLRFFGGKRINIKAFSRSAGVEPFYYKVRYYTFDHNGDQQAVMYSQDSSLTVTTAVTPGLVFGTVNHTYVADIPSYNLPNTVLWDITIPSQHSTNGNSNGYGLEVRY